MKYLRPAMLFLFSVIVVVLVGIFINHSNSIVVSLPENFCIYNSSGSEYDLQSVSIENGKRTYHIEVDESCLNSPSSYVYVTGNYWGYFIKPVVHLDGENVKVSTMATGYGGEKNYHFYIRNVVQDQKYRIYVRCGEWNDYMNVVFHS